MNGFLYRVLRISRALTALGKGHGGAWAKRSAKSYGLAKLTGSWRAR